MIHFLNLKKINKPFEATFQEKLKHFFEEGWYILGNEVKQFETDFANYCGLNYAVGVGNGLDAITLTLKAYIVLGKVQKGDEVIVPSNTYIATILAILQADLVPILVEPKLETFNINPHLIEEKITPRTKVILPVHLYGQLCEMENIEAIAKKYNLLIIEDSAQYHGAFSQFSQPYLNHTKTFSFYPGKNLGALGDAGAVVTNDIELFETIKMLRNYGSQVKYKNEIIGVNSRLDELQASFLNIKLPYLDKENNRRREIAKRYLSEIKNKNLQLPFCNDIQKHVFHLFVIRTENRINLQKYLYENGIETMIHYPIAPHKQKAITSLNHLLYPISEKIHNEVLSLPLNSSLTDDEATKIIRVLNKL